MILTNLINFFLKKMSLGVGQPTPNKKFYLTRI